MSSPAILNAEAELLLLGARTRPAPEALVRIGQLLEEAIAWPHVLRYAATHGLMVLLYHQLNTGFRDSVPPEVLRQLQAYASATAFRSMSKTRELLRLVSLLEAQGIEVIPFKGPMLAAFIYGDVALRNFADLDVLVRRHHFPEVKAVLGAEGYEPYRQLNEGQEAAFLDTQMGYEFIHRDRQVIVEVHWAFLNRVHAFKLDPERVWQRSHVQSFAGTQVRRFSSEDLLIYLCAHGAKSFWERARWICDVAELVGKEEALDWSYVLEQSRRLHGERILFLGLRLARDLFGARLPASVSARIREDHVAAHLAAQVTARLFGAPGVELGSWEKMRFHLKMRERFVDRIPYYIHLAKQTLKSRSRSFFPVLTYENAES